MVKMTTIKVILNIIIVENLHLEQMNVKTTFLHGDLEKEVHIEQLQDYVVSRKEVMMCKLKKSLYGLKHAPKQW